MEKVHVGILGPFNGVGGGGPRGWKKLELLKIKGTGHPKLKIQSLPAHQQNISGAFWGKAALQHFKLDGDLF